VRDELTRSVAEHRPIVEAIAGGDPDEAERLMRAHVRHGGEGYREIFGRARRQRGRRRRL
jgi:DNA-binding GntR family transcriptional regulator